VLNKVVQRGHAAIAVLWIEFVREVRWYWDEGRTLPRMSPNARPDLSTCLLHQKLQLVHNYFSFSFTTFFIYH
jgi:hypothetical protein